MIDKEILRSSYSRMTDGQLIALAQNEGEDLTSEALGILHEEFVNRKLDTAVFGIVEESKSGKVEKLIEAAKDHASNEFIRSIWNQAFDSKKDGVTDQQIHKELMAKGLDDEHASLIVNTLESKAKENLDAHDTEMLTGGLTFAAGVIITVWTISSSLNGFYIVAWGAIIFGAIRFYKGVSNKDRYKTILANIDIERSSKG